MSNSKPPAIAEDGTGILWPVPNAEVSIIPRQLRSSRPEVYYSIPLEATAPSIAKEQIKSKSLNSHGDDDAAAAGAAAASSPEIKQERKKVRLSTEDDEVFIPSGVTVSAKSDDKPKPLEPKQKKTTPVGAVGLPQAVTDDKTKSPEPKQEKKTFQQVLWNYHKYRGHCRSILIAPIV